MIPTDLRVDGVDPEAWRNLQRALFPPPRVGARRPMAPPLLLFVEGGVLVKAVRPSPGGGERIDPASLAWEGPWSLGGLRRAVGAPIAAAIVDDALDRIARAVDGKLDPRANLVQQALEAGRVVRAEVGHGLLLDPDPVSILPVPPFGAVQRTWDTLFPDDRSAGLFVFDEAAGGVWTSLLVEKRGGDAVRVTTHAALGVSHPAFRGGRHRELLAAMERELARPHLALFCSLDAWRAIAGPDAGALARQIAARDAIVDPAPPWLLALTGMGAVAGVAQEASRLFGRFIPSSVKQAARSVAASPFAALGFDPIEVFAKLQAMFSRHPS